MSWFFLFFFRTQKLRRIHRQPEPLFLSYIGYLCFIVQMSHVYDVGNNYWRSITVRPPCQLVERDFIIDFNSAALTLYVYIQK